MVAEYQATMCVVWVGCVHAQNPLFRHAYGAATSPIHTMRHPPHCRCVCYGTAMMQQRHDSGSHHGGGAPGYYVCGVGVMREYTKPAFSTPIWCCNFTNTHNASSPAVLLCVL